MLYYLTSTRVDRAECFVVYCALLTAPILLHCPIIKAIQMLYNFTRQNKFCLIHAYVEVKLYSTDITFTFKLCFASAPKVYWDKTSAFQSESHAFKSNLNPLPFGTFWWNFAVYKGYIFQVNKGQYH